MQADIELKDCQLLLLFIMHILYVHIIYSDQDAWFIDFLDETGHCWKLGFSIHVELFSATLNESMCIFLVEQYLLM